MSNILTTIKADFLAARKAREAEVSSFLSSVIGDIEQKTVTAEGRIELTDEHVIATLKSYEKRILDFKSIENVAESAIEQLDKELAIVKKYLPTQLTEQEIRDEFTKLETNSLGVMMKHLKEKCTGLYDGALASKVAKEFV